MCRGNSFFLIIKEINILLKNDGGNPVLLRRYIQENKSPFLSAFSIMKLISLKMRITRIDLTTKSTKIGAERKLVELP